MDRLDAMRAFTAVADRGSFAEAARRLRLSPAAVTRAVAALEDQLGLLLLHRTTRSVRLTERGAVYHARCKQILDEIEDADTEVRGADATPRGRMAIAAPLTFGRLHVLPVVTALLRDHPGLVIRLMLSDRIVHLTDDGIDVAVRIGNPADSALMAIKVGEVRRVLTASPGYLARNGVPSTLSDLSQHDLIAIDGIDATADLQFGNASLRIDPRLAVNSADAAIQAVEAGLGIARCFSYQVHDAVQAGRLVLLDAFQAAASPVHILYPPRRLGSANVAAFIKAARTHFASLAALAGPGRAG